MKKKKSTQKLALKNIVKINFLTIEVVNLFLFVCISSWFSAKKYNFKWV